MCRRIRNAVKASGWAKRNFLRALLLGSSRSFSTIRRRISEWSVGAVPAEVVVMVVALVELEGPAIAAEVVVVMALVDLEELAMAAEVEVVGYSLVVRWWYERGLEG
jgi:hypothetical protein